MVKQEKYIHVLSPVFGFFFEINVSANHNELWYKLLAEMPPVGESTPDTDTTASDVVDTTVEMPLQVTPEAKRHSRSPTPPSLSR